MTQDITLDMLQGFLEKLYAGKFSDNEQEAFEQLNVVVTKYNFAFDYLTNEYFPEMVNSTNWQGKAQLLYTVDSVKKYAVPKLADVLSITLIAIYYKKPGDSETLGSLLEIILKYKQFDLVNLENGGLKVRFIASNGSFALSTKTIRQDLRIQLLKILLGKYSLTLTSFPLPDPTNIHEWIVRLNNVFAEIFKLQPSEFAYHRTLLPFSINSELSYTSNLACKVFEKDDGIAEYEYLMLDQYRIPLLPLIQATSITLEPGKIQFINEGVGSLPSFRMALAVAEDEFELANPVAMERVPPSSPCVIYFETSRLLQFLGRKNKQERVSILFQFEKFDLQYCYLVPFEMVGSWLEKLPIPLLPRTAYKNKFDFSNLSGNQFEELCYYIVSERLSDHDINQKKFTDYKWLSENGSSDRGRDIIATEIATNKKWVFQAKKEQITPSKLESEIKKFLGYIEEDPSIKPDIYALVTSNSVTDDTDAKGREILDQVDIEFTFWSGAMIDKEVEKYESVQQKFAVMVK